MGRGFGDIFRIATSDCCFSDYAESALTQLLPYCITG